MVADIQDVKSCNCFLNLNPNKKIAIAVLISGFALSILAVMPFFVSFPDKLFFLNHTVVKIVLANAAAAFILCPTLYFIMQCVLSAIIYRTRTIENNEKNIKSDTIVKKMPPIIISENIKSQTIVKKVPPIIFSHSINKKIEMPFSVNLDHLKHQAFEIDIPIFLHEGFSDVEAATSNLLSDTRSKQVEHASVIRLAKNIKYKTIPRQNEVFINELQKDNYYLKIENIFKWILFFLQKKPKEASWAAAQLASISNDCPLAYATELLALYIDLKNDWDEIIRIHNIKNLLLLELAKFRFWILSSIAGKHGRRETHTLANLINFSRGFFPILGSDLVNFDDKQRDMKEAQLRECKEEILAAYSSKEIINWIDAILHDKKGHGYFKAVVIEWFTQNTETSFTNILDSDGRIPLEMVANFLVANEILKDPQQPKPVLTARQIKAKDEVEQKDSGFNLLPNEISYLIFSYLDIHSLRNVCVLSKKMQRLATPYHSELTTKIHTFIPSMLQLLNTFCSEYEKDDFKQSALKMVEFDQKAPDCIKNLQVLYESRQMTLEKALLSSQSQSSHSSQPNLHRLGVHITRSLRKYNFISNSEIPTSVRNAARYHRIELT